MKISKKSLVILSLFTSNVVLSGTEDNFSDNGIYIVGQLGSGQVEAGFLDNLFGSTKFTKNTGIAGRIGMGYQINRYLGLEGGLSLYSAAIRDYDSSRGLRLWSEDTKSVGQSNIEGIYSADVMGMLRIPIGNYFFVGTGAGIAAIHFNYSAMHTTNPTTVSPSWDAGSAYFMAPKAELRIGSKINQKTLVYLSVSHIFSVNGSNPEICNYQPAISLFALGINYSGIF